MTPLEFDGPPNWHCMGQAYVVISHGGLKKEGEAIVGGLCDTEAEAWDKFNREIATYLVGAQQIAWRRRASADQEDGKYKVTARLARFPEGSEA